MTHDPAGYYATLELEPDATPEAIATAFRSKARVLHPDIMGTGDAAAFMRVRAAYDVLGDADRRAAYDRAARSAVIPQMAQPVAEPTWRGPRLTDLPITLWAGLGGVFCLAAIMAAVQFSRPPPQTAASASSRGINERDGDPLRAAGQQRCHAVAA
jgi:curved DNA-binding protein CbpA